MFFSSGNHRLMFFLFFTFFSVSILTGQERPSSILKGAALADQGLDYRYNPAALGTGRCNGFGLFYYPLGVDSELDSEDILSRYGVQLSLAPVAYGLIKEDSKWYHRIDLALGSGMPFAVGTRFTLSAGDPFHWDLGFLFRPHSSLSLGGVATSLGTAEGTYQLGLGIRPLHYINSEIGTRFSLGVDTRVNNRFEWELPSLEARLEPIDGLTLGGGFDFNNNKWFSSITLQLGKLRSGHTITGTTEKIEDWQEDLFLNFKKPKTDLRISPNRIYQFDSDITLSDTSYSLNLGFLHLGGPKTYRFYPFIEMLKRIRDEGNVKALVFRNAHIFGDRSHLEEIRQVLLEMKTKGTKIIFYLEDIYNFEYPFIASVADTILLNPTGIADVRGYAIQKLYLRDFLSTLGIRVYNFRSHTEKSFGNYLSESSMPEEERKAIAAYLEGINEYYIDLIEEGRHPHSSRTLLENGPYFIAEDALEAGVVDQLIWEDELEDWLKEETGTPLILPARNRPEMDNVWAYSDRAKIAILYADGDIMKGKGGPGTVGAEEFIKTIRTIRKDPTYEGILLRVNSGGGSAAASEMIFRELTLAAEENGMKVVVSMGGVAASGGYLIALPAERIVASPGTTTGSIGVVFLFGSIEGLLEKLNITSETIKTSPRGDSYNITRDLTEEEQARFEAAIRHSYETFIEKVMDRRKLSSSEAAAAAQGRVWTGTQAQDLGLVDNLGGIGDALAVLEELLGNPLHAEEINPTPKYPLSLSSSGILPPFLLSDPDYAEALSSVLPPEARGLLEELERVSRLPRKTPLYWLPPTEEDSTAKIR